jgi:putative FmdB family regulatory protein
MPTYEYVCKSCGHTFEIVRPMSDDTLTVCPECGGELRKVFAPPSIAFKGSGFYATDHGKKSKKASEKPAEKRGDAGGDTGGAKDGDKPAASGEKKESSKPAGKAAKSEPSGPSGGSSEGSSS